MIDGIREVAFNPPPKKDRMAINNITIIPMLFKIIVIILAQFLYFNKPIPKIRFKIEKEPIIQAIPPIIYLRILKEESELGNSMEPIINPITTLMTKAEAPDRIYNQPNI